MQIGVLAYLMDRGISPVDLARLLEETAISTMLVPDHTHLPVTDGDMPAYAMNTQVYARFMDPFVALTAAAAVTTRLELGTGILLLPQREPIALAKAAGSLDYLSGGRFTLGVAPGWHNDELRHHGIDPRDRYAVFDEYITALREIWTNQTAEFHGRFVDFGPSMSWPKPVRLPRLPIIIGGAGPMAPTRAIRNGDGWYPAAEGEAQNLLDLLPRAQEFRTRAVEAGRPDLQLWVLSERHEPSHVEAMQRLSPDLAVFAIAPGDEASVRERVAEIAAVADQVA